MPLLQHYTSRDGFIGIAKSKTLWATDFLSLNDKSELFYGYSEMTLKALRTSITKIHSVLPPEYHRLIDFEEASKKIVDHYQKSYEGENGSERLYVTSFARAKNADQMRRGILTLWQTYTGNKGYCLVFEEADIKNMLKLENETRNYALLDLGEVTYGIDESQTRFQQLHHQLTHRLFAEVERERPDLGLRLCDFERLWPLGTFATQMLSYCAMHKDPGFVDEREVRITACPAKVMDSRVLTGPAFRKPVKVAPNGKSYIEMFEDWHPGIEPQQIIVGPQANRNLDEILELFSSRPEVTYSDIPIR